MSAPPSQPPPIGDAPPGYDSPTTTFEGAPQGSPPVVAATDQNQNSDPAAEALVHEFEAYDFGNDAEFRVSAVRAA